MSYPESNFEAWLTDLNGRMIPGSYRHGHNIITRYGKDWLAELVRWTYPVAGIPADTVPPLSGSNDAAIGQRRLRWIMTGNPTQFPGGDVPFEDDDVVKLKHGIPHQIGPNAYLKPLPTPLFPTILTLKYVVAYGPADFAGFAVDISEFGAFADVDDGGGPGLDTTINTHTPVAYKTVDPPLAKDATNTLNITWEFRF